MPRTRKELEDLKNMASVLGFTDDVEHWTKELEKLDNESNNT